MTHMTEVGKYTHGWNNTQRRTIVDNKQLRAREKRRRQSESMKETKITRAAALLQVH